MKEPIPELDPFGQPVNQHFAPTVTPNSRQPGPTMPPDPVNSQIAFPQRPVPAKTPQTPEFVSPFFQDFVAGNPPASTPQGNPADPMGSLGFNVSNPIMPFEAPKDVLPSPFPQIPDNVKRKPRSTY